MILIAGKAGKAGKTMGRKFVVGGNWKMNGDQTKILEIVNFLKAGPLDNATQVVVGVPAIYLQYAKANLPDNIEIAAQNCYKVPSGAFTGNYIFLKYCAMFQYKINKFIWVTLTQMSPNILFNSLVFCQ